MMIKNKMFMFNKWNAYVHNINTLRTHSYSWEQVAMSIIRGLGLIRNRGPFGSDGLRLHWGGGGSTGGGGAAIGPEVGGTDGA